MVFKKNKYYARMKQETQPASERRAVWRDFEKRMAKPTSDFQRQRLTSCDAPKTA